MRSDQQRPQLVAKGIKSVFAMACDVEPLAGARARHAEFELIRAAARANKQATTVLCSQLLAGCESNLKGDLGAGELVLLAKTGACVGAGGSLGKDTELFDEWRDIVKRERREPDEKDETEWCSALQAIAKFYAMSETSHG